MKGKTLRLCVFTTMHPVGDVRVDSKVVQSFVAKGWDVVWIGPERHDFPQNDDLGGIRYALAEFSGTRIGRLAAVPRLARSLVKARGIDLVYTPEPDSAAIALLLRPFHRGKIFFDIHENYHESALKRWVPRAALPGLSVAVRLAISLLASRSSVSTAVNSDIAALYSLGDHKPLVLRNLAPRSFAKTRLGDEAATLQNSPVFFFHGKASPDNGTKTLLEAWALLTGKPRLKLVLIPRMTKSTSDMFPGLRPMIKELGLEESVVLLPPVAHDKMPELLDSMDVGLISYQRDLGIDSLPNRFFEYLARGLPTITPSYSHHIVDIVDQTECGVSVDMESPSDIAQAVAQLADNPSIRGSMGNRGLVAFRESLSWESEFDTVYKAICKLFPGDFPTCT